MTQKEIHLLRECRKKVFLASCRNGTAHIASAFSSMELLYTLYGRGVLRLDMADPAFPSRDRFVLSKGHAAIGLYAVLETLGILERGETETFLTPGTRLAGEPCRNELPWVEASTGALGHGLSIGVGMALAQKLDGTGARTFVLLGDGECQEGSVWEAAMSAAAQRLDNLVAILDCNGLQKMCQTRETMGRAAWKEKWSAFGWQISETDGHDVDALCKELSEANAEGMPRLLIAHTIKGKGVSIMENDANWHYKELKKKDVRIIANELGVSGEELEACREHI